MYISAILCVLHISEISIILFVIAEPYFYYTVCYCKTIFLLYCLLLQNHISIRPTLFVIAEPYEVFVVFHDLGYAVYNPRACSLQLEVEGHRIAFRSSIEHSSASSYSSSDQVSSLCRPGNRCSWGDAVNVRNRFLYVSQPNLNRIIVIEISKGFKPLEVSVIAHCCTLLHNVTHCCTLFHIAAHCCTLLHIVAHCCTLLQDLRNTFVCSVKAMCRHTSNCTPSTYWSLCPDVFNFNNLCIIYVSI